VDESAEAVAAPNRVWSRLARELEGWSLRVGWCEVERPVWPVAVVVVGEDPEHLLEVSSAEDQTPVEALGAGGANEALGDGVRLRRSHRRANDLEPFAAEHVVEAARELAVSIANQEAERRRAFRERPGELSGLLGDPGAAGISGTAGEMHGSAAELDEEEDVQPLQRDGLDGKKSTAIMPRACVR
jgi:hypothetical protein